MNKKPKVSIIMPTYNVEKYFRQCLESVINQTLADIEIIPVDDGSPDNCGKIMDEYAAKDSRIKPIHQQNGGYGKAVNAGIAAATGEYVGIVETDDWCEPEMFEKLYTKAKELDADVCKCGFYKYNSQESPNRRDFLWKDDIQNFEIFPKDKAFKINEHPKLFLIHASIWTNLYKKEFLNKHGIKVNGTQGASYQDFPFMAEVFCKAEKIAVLPEYLYHWRVEPNQNSSTTSNGAKLLIMPDQCEEVKKIIKEANLYEEIKEEMYKHFFLANWLFYNTVDQKLRKIYFKKLHNLFKELKNDKVFTYKYFYQPEIDFIKKVIDNKYNPINWLGLRRRIVQIRWNKEERYVKILGKIVLRGK